MVDLTPEQERDALAGELALGLIEGEDRAIALRLCLSDRGFADAVEDWNVRLAPLFDEITNVPAPMTIWGAIEARIKAPDFGGIQRRLRVWRSFAVGMGAIAASLALYLVVSTPPPPVQLARPNMAVAQLVDAGGGPVVTAAFDASKGVLHLRSDPIETAALAPELWVIPTDGVPRSLGLIASKGLHDLNVDPALRGFMSTGSTLAITAEDPTSAPHAAPSAAPILAGKISAI